MLNLSEIDRAIAELEAGRTTFASCSKLADLYAVRDKLGGRIDRREYDAAQSFSSEPVTAGAMTAEDSIPEGGSDFLQTIEKKDMKKTLSVIDELMDSLHIVNPRLYENIMRKLRNL